MPQQGAPKTPDVPLLQGNTAVCSFNRALFVSLPIHPFNTNDVLYGLKSFQSWFEYSADTIDSDVNNSGSEKVSTRAHYSIKYSNATRIGKEMIMGL